MSKSIALLAGCVVIAVGCSIVCVASAATVNWSGSANTNWSLGGVGGNWSNAAIPTSADIARFTHLGEGGASNTLTNQVDVAFPETGGISTIQALVYEINPTDSTLYYHRTEIVANRTLLATNNWTVNRVTGGLPLTEATINLEIAGGPGSKFQVGNTDATTATVVLGNHGSTNTKININIDMSELETFHAYVNTFGAAATNQPVPFNLQLAKNNLIRGNMLDFAYAGGNNSNPVNMYLGETNTLHLNDIKLSAWKTPGTVEFNSIWTNPELTIRGLTGGTSRANLQLGISEASTGTVTTGVLNLSGGTVDAMLDTLTLAAANLGGQTIGTFTMSDGVVDALTVLAGQSSGASNGIATATLNIQGGLFIANNMTLGQRLASASANNTASGTLNISGGDVTVGSLLLGNRESANGTATGIVNLSAGSLTAGVISKGATGVATINFTGGRLAADSIGFSLLQQGGTFAVETASTTITGDYTQLAAGTLEVTLINPLTTALAVTGAVSLAGQLEVVLGSGYYVLDGEDSVDIITATSITGQFSNAADGERLLMNDVFFTVHYYSDRVTLSDIQLLPVPEPTSAGLVVLGCLALIRRRKK